MTEYPAIRDPNRCPTHPGELLADILEDLPYTKTEVARMLGLSRQHLHDLLNARKPVSGEVAARIGKLMGNGPGLWLRMQAGFDAWHAEREVDVSAIPSLPLEKPAA